VIITVGDNKFDVTALESPADLISFLDKMEGQTTLLDSKLQDKMGKRYELFDELLPREVAIANLIEEMKRRRDKLSEKLYPPSVAKAYKALYEIKQEQNYILPTVDSFEFELLNKLALFHELAYAYLNTMIYSRIGYTLALKITSNGQIYALRDLRELHKPFI
jgi:hypothetical protein